MFPIRLPGQKLVEMEKLRPENCIASFIATPPAMDIYDQLQGLDYAHATCEIWFQADQ